jgi:hypothetical protein
VTLSEIVDGDRVGFVLQPEGGSSEQYEEADVRQGVRDELRSRTPQRVAKLNQIEYGSYSR